MSGGASNGGTGVLATRPQFLAFVKDAADIAMLRAYSEKNGWGSATVYEGDIATATDMLRSHPAPYVLLVEIASAEAAPGLLDALADVCAPDVKVIVTGTVNEFSFYTWLTDIGIAAYLLRPIAEQSLHGALARLNQAAASAAGGARKEKEPAKVIAFMGTRGGVGATSLSICFAKYIAEVYGLNTALADLDPQDGSIALMLDLEPSRGLRDALEKPDRLDSLFLDRVLIRVGEKLAVLSAEESLAERIAYHETAAEALLKELRNQFDVVVMDLPRRLSFLVRQCLQLADEVVLVTEKSLVGLRDTMRLNEALRDHYKRKSPIIVANRVGMASKFEIAVQEFEKGAGVSVDHSVPFAPDVFMSISGEFSLEKINKTPVYGVLTGLAEQLVPGHLSPGPKREKKLLGFLKSKKE